MDVLSFLKKQKYYFFMEEKKSSLKEGLTHLNVECVFIMHWIRNKSEINKLTAVSSFHEHG